MEKAIKSLEDKLNGFIGFSKDPITTAEARGFKSGLMWAIDTLKTIKDQEDFEEDNGFTCDKCGGYKCRYECLMDI